MTVRVVGVLARPMPRPAVTIDLLGVRRKYRTLLGFKANPRSDAYMLDLLRERRGEAADVVRWDDDHDRDARLEDADEIVLLYPDATGLGFRPIEARLRQLAGTETTLTVINGRRREFSLEPRTRRALLVLRAAERSMLGELAATVLIIAMTPALVAFDHVRGRR